MATFNNKLFYLINSFSETELKELRKLISSPLYAKRKNYEQLLDIILKYPKTGIEKLTQHELYSLLYPGKKFSKQTLKNRLSELFGLCEEFIVYKSLNDKKIEKDKILLKEYLERKHYGLFESKYLKTKKFVIEQPENETKFRDISFLNEINLSLLNNKRQVNDMYSQYFENATYTTCIQLINLLELGIEFRHQDYDGRRYDFNIVIEVLKRLKMNDLIKHFMKNDLIIYKVVCIFYFLYMAFSNMSEEKYFFESRRIFKENSKFLSLEFRDDIYKLMINYCIQKQNAGEKKFVYELFTIYNEKLDQGMISDFRRKMFPVNIFRDYVYIGLEVSKLDWVEDLVKKYSKELPEEIREDEINLTFAKVYERKGNYKKSLEYLSKVTGKNYIHYLDASMYKLSAYYELEKYEDAFLEIDRLKHYLKSRKEIPAIHYEYNHNFVRSYTKLLKLKTQNNNPDFGFLKKEIIEHKYISRRNWLIEKVS